VPPGIVRPDEWGCVLIDFLIRVTRHTRVHHPCKACGGDKCRACNFAGFVPEREALMRVRDGQAGFEFGDPWDQPEGETDEHRDRRDAG
jgi:hypothetical protein